MINQTAEPVRNPADAPIVTLDTNALVALHDAQADAPHVQAILAMNHAGQIVVNITLSTALEAGRGGQRFTWADRAEWLEGLGIAKINLFSGPRTIGLVDSQRSGGLIFDSDLERRLNQRVHEILRPTIPFLWRDYLRRECESAGWSIEAMAEYDYLTMEAYMPPTPQHPRLPPLPHYDALGLEQQDSLRAHHERLRRQWNNAKNDSLGLYNHLTTAAHTVHPEWSVFVTSDHHFLAQTKIFTLRDIGFQGEILPPAKAIAFLRSVIGEATPQEP